jgi:hypothetical protein
MPFFTRSRCSWLSLRSIIGWLCLGLALFVLPGCSAVKVGYNQLPTLSYWWLDSYVDFDSTQTTQVRAQLATLLAKHRQEELPGYAQTLAQLQLMAPTPISAEQMCQVYTDFQPRLQFLLNQLEQPIAAMAPSFTTKQLQELARQLDKSSQKWHDELFDGTPSERREVRVKRWVDRTEMIYGRLSSAQLAVLRASTEASIFNPDLSLRESRRRQEDLLRTLRLIQAGGLSPAQNKTEVHGLLQRSLNSPDPLYVAYMDKMKLEYCQVLAQLHNSTSTAQKRHAVERLKDYEVDLRALHLTKP